MAVTMRNCVVVLAWLAASIAPGTSRTMFPYIGSGNRYTIRAAIPMDFPANVTFLRVHATSDVGGRWGGAIQYKAVVSTNRELPFKVTADGGLQLVRKLRRRMFRRMRKDRWTFKFNIVAGVASESEDERAVLAVELLITRRSLDCNSLTEEDRCWGPWGFLSGLQWFEAADSGASASDLLTVDLRSPIHTICGAPSYRFSVDRGESIEDGSGSGSTQSPQLEPIGSAVSVLHLGAAGRDRLRLTVACTPDRADKEEESLSKKRKVLGVDVLDRNNHPPEVDTHDAVHDVYLCGISSLFKGSLVLSEGKMRPNVFVRDKDDHETSHYEVRIESDPAGLFAVKHGEINIPTGEGQQRRLQSMLFAELTYKRNARPYAEFGPGFNYSVQVVFEDKYLHHSYGNKALNVTVSLLSSCRPLPTTPPPPTTVSVPADALFTATVRRDASKFARILQLPRSLASRPLKLAPSPDDSHQLFNITEKEAILYVLRPGRLRERRPGVLNLTLVSRGGGGGDRSGAAATVNVSVSVNVTAPLKEEGKKQPEKECPMTKNPGHCAAESTEKECTSLCGAGAEGRCGWRPPPLNRTLPSASYGTCSSHLRTCPDGRCDELESLSPALCPQDCVSADDGRLKTPLLEFGHSKRGLAKGLGVCYCLSVTSCVCSPTKHAPLPSERNMTKDQRASATSVTPRSELAAAHETSVCGTACIIGVSLGVVLLLAMLLLVCMIYDSRCGRSSKMRKDPFGGEVISLSHITGDMDLGGRQQMALPPDAQCAISAQLLETVPVDDKWEFPRRRLILGELLGEGEFGKVLQGKAMGIAGDTGCRQVAVKMLKPSSTPAELQDLLSEYNLLKEVNHPNVIKLLGACTGPGGPVCIIIEYAELGCLRKYLCNSRKSTLASGDSDTTCAITPKELISYAWQISRGMSYLGEMKLVHRDLAARNVLLAEGKMCKISDFGLTRDVYEGSLYQKTSKGRVPVKWMAIESLEDHVYTSKSDVWSFGVLLWELITLGSNPYPGVTPERLCHLLKSGYRMDRPANCTQDMYSIMRQCWQEQPSSRPTFPELSQWFDRMLQSGSEYLDLSTPLVLNREYFDLLSDGDDLDMDRPIDYGNLHLLSSSYLPPRSQPPTEEPSVNQSPRRPADADQSPFRSNIGDSPALKSDRLVYSSLLLHGSDAEDAAEEVAPDLPLNYSSLLLPDSEPEEDGEGSGSGSSQNHTPETCDEQCGLMEVSV